MRIVTTIVCLIISISPAFSQKSNTDAHIIGHVTANGEHIPYATVFLQGTTIGTVTDKTGHFSLLNLPLGNYTLEVRMVGYKTQEKEMNITAGITREIKFDLEEDVLRMDEVVVSANRSEKKRNDAPVIVNTLGRDVFKNTQSPNLGEGLNFTPGLRLENNCQNCGFSQVRMNGLEGPYSQILINSRPVFSGLAGVYGLELIPYNMIEKVEVVRGGGSALYGSNAIAGTINVLLKDPLQNSFEAGADYSLMGSGVEGKGGLASGYSVNFNTSVVSDNQKSGISLYGYKREREPFDANGDGFSELSEMESLAFGARAFQRAGTRGRLNLDFFTIHEDRVGGNKFDLPYHQRDVAEGVEHKLNNVSLTFEHYFREYDQLSLYLSGQFLDRDSYYGANQSLSDYGESKDRTWNAGAQYKAVFDNTTLVTGVENTGSFLTDRKLGYPDYGNALIVGDSIVSVPNIPNTLVADQVMMISGTFVQYDIRLGRAKLAAGARFDHYEIRDLAGEADSETRGNVFSPRFSFMYDILSDLKARVSYSQGYRAPQIFDEDLHIETSGIRQVINVNDPELKQETSHSFMASLDLNAQLGEVYTGFLLEGFYTLLEDPFVNEIGEPEEDGTVYYTRVNAENGALVKGVNMEMRISPSPKLEINSGFTLQRSEYEEAQEFGEKRFFRSPETYGFLNMSWNVFPELDLAVNGTYTGSMLVPYFGPETDPVNGELRMSEDFLDLGIKVSYISDFFGLKMETFTGVKNLFNSYQKDFDYGPGRDPAYMYGPFNPRTVYFGIKIGG